MDFVPNWILMALKAEKLRCPQCKEVFNDKSITALGIRQSFKNKNKESLFIELTCTKCGKMTLFELQDMTLMNLAIDILEEMGVAEVSKMEDEDVSSMVEEKLESSNVTKKPHKPPQRAKSKITLREIKESADFLNSIKTHHEFLEALGFSPQEIENYKNDK